MSGAAGGSGATVQLWGRRAVAAPSSRARASRGLKGSRGTSYRAPGDPTAPVPTGVGTGSGGEGATGGGAGGFSGAAELNAHMVVHVPSATLGLRTFARSRAPEPFLLLLERPG